MRRPAGFTLIETLLAFAVVAIALAVLIQGVGQSASGEGRAETILAAKTVAEERLAGLGLTTPLSVGESRGEVGSLTWDQRISYWNEGEATAAGLRAVQVTVIVKDHRTGQPLIRLETVRLAMASGTP